MPTSESARGKRQKSEPWLLCLGVASATGAYVLTGPPAATCCPHVAFWRTEGHLRQFRPCPVLSWPGKASGLTIQRCHLPAHQSFPALLTPTPCLLTFLLELPLGKLFSPQGQDRHSSHLTGQMRIGITSPVLVLACGYFPRTLFFVCFCFSYLPSVFPELLPWFQIYRPCADFPHNGAPASICSRTFDFPIFSGS